MQLSQAMKLSPDLFTPLTRTPWAGHRIAALFKRNLLPQSQLAAIGEAWEVSCDPSFPSQILGSTSSLSELIALQPEAMLSADYVKENGPSCEILIKLLNADDPLSVQVHPDDNDPALKPNECGKPESWLVLDAEAHAGIYLGFSKAIERKKLELLLSEKGDLRPWLQFVPVKVGDYFEIQPGVPHAIGPGTVLLEPQRVIAGRSGKTFRLWDWGRRYDDFGQIDLKSGKARELHVDEALRLMRPEEQVGEDFVESLRRVADIQWPIEGVECHIYPANIWYQVIRLKITAKAALCLQIDRGFGTLVSLAGRYVCQGAGGNAQTFVMGEPGFLPHQSMPMIIRAELDSDLILVIPSGAEFRIQPLH